MDTLQVKNASPTSDFEKEVAALDPWFHNLHLPEGQTAPGHPLGDFPRFKWEAIAPHLPESLDGWTALDVGCNAGFYTFELARRGAQVHAIDVDESYLRQASWAAGKLGLEGSARFEKRSVYSAASDDARYDLVWFMGVFYHLRYPALALDLLARKATRLMVFQSLSRPQPAGQIDLPANLAYQDRARLAEPEWPAMAFIEGRMAGDPTNWWAPSPSALAGLLRTAGMEIVAQPDEETFVCKPARADDLSEGAKLARQEREALLEAFRKG